MKRVALIIFSLLCGICFSGCFLIKEAVNKSEKANKLEKQICENFEIFDYKNIKNDYTDNTSNVVLENNTTIIDYDKGLLKNPNIDKDIYCPKLKVLKSTSETKSFAVNGGGKDDFNAKVTKKLHIAQKILDGKVIEDDIKIANFAIEMLHIVKHNGFIYKADSPYIKKLDNDYNKLERTLRNNLPCFEMNRKTYCDGDFVIVWGSQIMLRVIESGYGQVKYTLYLTNRATGAPITQADYSHTEQFHMNPPDVIGNYELEKHKVQKFLLELDDIKTFKEW